MFLFCHHFAQVRVCNHSAATEFILKKIAYQNPYCLSCFQHSESSVVGPWNLLHTSAITNALYLLLLCMAEVRLLQKLESRSSD